MPGACRMVKRCSVPVAGTNPAGTSSAYSRTSIAWPSICASRARGGSGSPSAIRRVLDLQPGVHLKEPEGPVAVQYELDGARAGVADRPARGDGRGGQRGAQACVDGRRRALLDDLLVAALDGTLALEHVDHGARGVAEDLHLDMPGVDHVALEEHGAVAERGGRLAACAGDRLGQFRGACDQPHAAAAAAERRLDQQRESHAGGRFGQVAVVGDGHPWQHGYAGVGHRGLGRDLIAHRGDDPRRGAHEYQAGAGTGLRERGVL